MTRVLCWLFGHSSLVNDFFRMSALGPVFIERQCARCGRKLSP